MKILDRIQNYLYGKSTRRYKSELNGELEVCYHNGIKMLHSGTANYSYGGLHQVFRKALASAKITAKQPETVLILGFAAGSIASILQEELQISCSITAIEYDPVIIDIFHAQFHPERFEKLMLINMDAAEFMASNQDKFDLICVDVFNDRDVPESCLKEEFLKSLVKSLNSKGTLLYNFIPEREDQRSRYKALKGFFSAMKGQLKEKFVAPSNMVLIWEKR